MKEAATELNPSFRQTSPQATGALGLGQRTQEFVLIGLQPPSESPSFCALHFFPVNAVWLQTPLCSPRFIGNR